jgi:hypothetical protein
LKESQEFVDIDKNLVYGCYMDNNPDRTTRLMAVITLAVLILALPISLWLATPNDPDCHQVRPSADEATGPAYGYDYDGHRWTDDQGRVAGWSVEEDTAWYATPGCAGVVLD